MRPEPKTKGTPPIASGVLLLGLLLVPMAERTTWADPSSLASGETGRRLSASYCGLYCLYSAIKLQGRDVLFQDILKPEYMGSRQGSSIQELKQAAEDQGLRAAAVRNLAGRELMMSPDPLILHVKSSPNRQAYDHYVLCLGTRNGKARIFDPPNPVTLVSFADLAAVWDGNGLIVSSRTIDLGRIFAPVRRQSLLLAAGIVAAVMLARWARRFVPTGLFQSRRAFLGLSLGQMAGLAVVTILCGMFYHFFRGEGLLANAKATEAIQQAYAGDSVPKVSQAEVRRLMGAGAILIDARLARDYEAGHLNGAINVPMDVNDAGRLKATASIPKDAKVVVYCQSKGCEFAGQVAIRLMEDGFSDVVIYQGGWAEWAAETSKRAGKGGL